MNFYKVINKYYCESFKEHFYEISRINIQSFLESLGINIGQIFNFFFFIYSLNFLRK